MFILLVFLSSDRDSLSLILSLSLCSLLSLSLCYLSRPEDCLLGRRLDDVALLRQPGLRLRSDDEVVLGDPASLPRRRSASSYRFKVQVESVLLSFSQSKFETRCF